MSEAIKLNPRRSRTRRRAPIEFISFTQCSPACVPLPLTGKWKETPIQQQMGFLKFMLNKLLFSPHHLSPFLAGFLQLSRLREVQCRVGPDSSLLGVSPMEEMDGAAFAEHLSEAGTGLGAERGSFRATQTRLQIHSGNSAVRSLGHRLPVTQCPNLLKVDNVTLTFIYH